MEFCAKKQHDATQPADYFAYALTQLYRDKHSERTKICMPILGDENSAAIGAVWKREQVRGNLALTEMFVNMERKLRDNVDI